MSWADKYEIKKNIFHYKNYLKLFFILFSLIIFLLKENGFFPLLMLVFVVFQLKHKKKFKLLSGIMEAINLLNEATNKKQQKQHKIEANLNLSDEQEYFTLHYVILKYS